MRVVLAVKSAARARPRIFAVAVAGCALAAAGGGWWLAASSGSPSVAAYTREYLRSAPGARVVTMDDYVSEVLAAVRRGPAACAQTAQRISGQVGAAALGNPIRSVPDGDLGEELIDEASLMHAAVTACAASDVQAASYAGQLSAVHQLIHHQLAGLGVAR